MAFAYLQQYQVQEGPAHQGQAQHWAQFLGQAALLPKGEGPGASRSACTQALAGSKPVPSCSFASQGISYTPVYLSWCGKLLLYSTGNNHFARIMMAGNVRYDICFQKNQVNWIKHPLPQPKSLHTEIHAWLVSLGCSTDKSMFNAI